MKKFFLMILLFFSTLSIYAGTLDPLTADQAFQLSATAKDYQTILLKFKIAPQHFLYQEKFGFKVVKPENVSLGYPLYPAGAQLLKTSIGNFSVYGDSLIIPIPIIDATEKNILLQVKYEGCSQAGYCYPPVTKIVSVNLAGNYMQYHSPLAIDIGPQKITETKKSLFEKSFFMTLMTFFGFGLLLSLTPCVLPMIPILSSIIVGRKNPSHFHAFLLSLFYVLGMAFLYAVIGVIFGIIGKNIQIVFQNPYVIIAFSLLFVLMAMSMFGLFHLQLPEKFRAMISSTSERQKRGSYLGVFIMGALSVLILSPCVTPPLVAALGYIGETGDAGLGGLALFVMGLGTGVPLLLIGLIGSKALPKPGRWMNLVKYTIGVLLLVVAVLMVSRVLVVTTSSSEAFQSVQTLSQIETVLKQPQKNVIMLDFYANWCISCKELDKFTFSKPAVQEKLKNMTRVRIDISDNSPETAAIMQHFGVIAPPTILFFKDGAEIPNSRIVGYVSANQLISKAP